MATARFRQTVKYPSLADEPIHMDEDEQDMLISSLKSRNAAQNRVYCTILLLITILLSLSYVPLLRSNFFPALLSITSLALTSLALYPSTSLSTYLSPHARAVSDSAIELSTLWTGNGPDLAGGGAPYGMSVKKWGKMPARPANETDVFGGAFAGQSRGPLQRALPIINAVACAFLILLAFTKHRRGQDRSSYWAGPSAVWALVWLAGRVMRSVNVSELEQLKYKLKGA